jgi:hypothetical protein
VREFIADICEWQTLLPARLVETKWPVKSVLAGDLSFFMTLAACVERLPDRSRGARQTSVFRLALCFLDVSLIHNVASYTGNCLLRWGRRRWYHDDNATTGYNKYRRVVRNGNGSYGSGSNHRQHCIFLLNTPEPCLERADYRYR